MDSDFNRKKHTVKKPDIKEPEPQDEELVVEEEELLNEVSVEEPGPEPELDEEGEAMLHDKPKKTTKTKRRSPIAWFKGLSKKQKILFCAVLIIVLGGVITGTVLALKKPKQDTPAAQAQQEEAAPPTTEPSKLTGVDVPLGSNDRPVTGIMIENSPDARPQAGLKDAGVVFEAIAEGGITRFLTLFQEARPEYIGPVRSVRPYYLDWLQGFDAPIAHAGGSGEALAKIKTDGVRDLDQFANAKAFDRVNGRYAPHNLYTSMAKLDELNKSKGFTSSKFEGFARKAEKASATPTAKGIDLNVSSALYNVRYDYDAASNTYKRTLGGKPHTDEKSGAQIAPKVVIANVMTYGIASNGVNSTYGTIGSGKTFIFQDGMVYEGTWEKTDRKTQMVFKDANGTVIQLNPGQTWITAVKVAGNVTFQP